MGGFMPAMKSDFVLGTFDCEQLMMAVEQLKFVRVR